MNRFPGLRRFMRLDRGGTSIEHAVDDELQFHFDMTMRELMASGMSEDAARREARQRFGDLERTRERLASIDRSRIGRERRAEWWGALSQDLRYAVRGLRLAPGFAAAVVVTLGLGIGANATMFGIVDRLLFRPPRFLNAPDRATRIYLGQTYRGTENLTSFTGYRPYLDLRQNSRSFDAMTPFYTPELAVGTGDGTREVLLGASDADLWRMFDVKPVIGRFFTDAETTPPHGAKVVVLAYSFWQMQFGGARNVLGTKLDIGSAKYTVIGVAPQGFNAFATAPLVGFIPVAAHASAEGYGAGPLQPWYSTYNSTWLQVFARRKPEVSVAQASADLTRAAQISYRKSLAVKGRDTPFDVAKPRAIAGPVLQDRGPNKRSDAKVATWLTGVAAMVLLIAYANVANLLLARSLRRRREIAVRIALGVSRARLLLQLVTESVLLSLLGGAAGVLIAQWGGATVRRLLLQDSGVDVNTLTDPRLVGFAASLAVAAGVLTGVAPLVNAGRVDIASALKAGAREGDVHRSRLRTSLLIGQAALSVVLLVGAGLFVRSLANVERLRLGYDPDRLVWVQPVWRGTPLDDSRKRQLLDALLKRAQALPGVEHAARGLTVPFAMEWDIMLHVAGIDSVSKLGQFTLQSATPDFFATMGTHLLRGRGFTVADVDSAPRVMVVGESMARRLWPNEDPIGKCVRLNTVTAPCTTVVGVAEDTRGSKLSEPELHYYLPTPQFNPDQGGVFVRVHGSADDATESTRRALQRMMPGSSYVTTTSMSSILAPEMRSWKLGAVMFAVFGALALVLAAIGLYSVIAYNVTQRMHEMGVRVALGAQARDVTSLIVREGLHIVGPGVLLGAIIALVAGRWVAPLLFDVSPRDPPVLAGVVVVLLGVAVLASWLPATRAARVDPNEALRAD